MRAEADIFFLKHGFYGRADSFYRELCRAYRLKTEVGEDIASFGIEYTAYYLAHAVYLFSKLCYHYIGVVVIGYRTDNITAFYAGFFQIILVDRHSAKKAALKIGIEHCFGFCRCSRNYRHIHAFFNKQSGKA